jgi:ubiquinone/menaquinone biosynthesis C-methylase UbiE
MDITDMSQYQNDMFDLIIDKGSFDGIMCDEKNGTFMGARMLSEVQRVLKPNGIYLVISLHLNVDSLFQNFKRDHLNF